MYSNSLRGNSNFGSAVSIYYVNLFIHLTVSFFCRLLSIVICFINTIKLYFSTGRRFIMSLLHDVLQDVGLAIDRPHSFLSFYSYLINCPIVLCEMLSRYSRQNDDVGSFVPMMKSDLLRLLYHPPNNILNDFPLHTRVMLISHVAEIFELLASWTLNQYEYDDEKSSPFYDAVENGRFSLDGSAYGQLKVNETLQQLLTDNEVYSILKHESYEFNSRQIEMDFSQRKAS